MTYDWLIVGAGFTGLTLAERLASRLDRRVLVVERRPHLGGNAYDELDDAGILVHRYGPHIFHTNSERVWGYLSRFTDWRPYEHRVRAVVDGVEVPLPFNLDGIDALFEPERARRYREGLLSGYGCDVKVPILKLRESGDATLRELADFVYQKIFLNYTLKQWALTPEQLDPSVTGRVPVLVGRDDRYFHDRHQAMPRAGYSAMFERMVDHPNVTVALGTDYREVAADTAFDRMVYTGPIDAFFDYQHGELPYRSLDFRFDTREVEYAQSVGTVNYPNDHAYTRITEQKRLTGQESPRTTLIAEFPRAHVPGETEPYYPVPRPDNRERYERYRRQAEGLTSVTFAGRLGDYRYYNMDQAVARALSLYDQLAADG